MLTRTDVIPNTIDDLVARFNNLVYENMGGDIHALYLRGSAARGEWIDGLSDIDFYLVVPDEAVSNPAKDINLKINQISQRLRSASKRISVRTVQQSMLQKNRLGSHLTGLDARLLLGSDILQTVPKPTINELKIYGDKYSRYLVDLWEKSSQTNSLEKIVANSQYMILKIAQNLLLSKGTVILPKNQIADKFLRTFPEFHLPNVVEEAVNIRSSWPRILQNHNEMKDFNKNALSFLSTIKKLLGKNQSQNTLTD